jgi:hypothetical protein
MVSVLAAAARAGRRVDRVEVVRRREAVEASVRWTAIDADQGAAHSLHLDALDAPGSAAENARSRCPP